MLLIKLKGINGLGIHTYLYNHRSIRPSLKQGDTNDYDLLFEVVQHNPLLN